MRVFEFGFWGLLLVASIMDTREKCVYRMIWVLSCSMVIPMLILAEPSLDGILSILFWCILEEGLFCGLYGRADSHCFVVSGMYLACFCNGENYLFAFVCHKLIAFLLLALVSTVEGNIMPTGNLRSPVAFIPYVVLALYCERFIVRF